MTEKDAQVENPAQPAGWAVGEPSNPDAWADGELLALEEKKREDTAAWIDAENRSPIDAENPAQPGGWGVQAPSGGPIRAASKDDCGSCPAGTKCVCTGEGCTCKKTADVIARVFASRASQKVAGSKVLLGTSEEDHQLGEVIAASDDKFWVAWRDGQDTVESKGDYELIIREDEE